MEKELEEIILFEGVLKIEDEMINEDGSFILREEEIYRDKKVKISVNPNEFCKHNRPHVHAKYETKEYVISIDNSIEELTRKNDKYSRMLIKQYVSTNENIQKFRKAWNEKVKSLLMFKIEENGEYSGETMRREN